jgi:hypothetical protein
MINKYQVARKYKFSNTNKNKISSPFIKGDGEGF